jgi:hypothetical protein
VEGRSKKSARWVVGARGGSGAECAIDARQAKGLLSALTSCEAVVEVAVAAAACVRVEQNGGGGGEDTGAVRGYCV